MVVVGVGELGGFFAQGLLRTGHVVVPWLRSSSVGQVVEQAPKPALVLVAVGEDDVSPVLGALPAPYRERVALLQNELVPHTWQAAGIVEPTVCVVWFEKKPNKPVTQLAPSLCFGPEAQRLQSALEALGIDHAGLSSREELLGALLRKNVYILTTNLAGLRTGGTVGELWANHRDFATKVAAEVLDLQEVLVGRVDRDEEFAALERAIAADPTHGCAGRSAPRRLARTLAHADRLAVEVPTLRSLVSR